jgi:hypothetical protein
MTHGATDLFEYALSHSDTSIEEEFGPDGVFGSLNCGTVLTSLDRFT